MGHVPPRPAALLPVAKLTSRGRKARGGRRVSDSQSEKERTASGLQYLYTDDRRLCCKSAGHSMFCSLPVCLMLPDSRWRLHPGAGHPSVMSDSHKPIVRSAHVHSCPPEAGNQLLPVIQSNAGDNTCLRLLGLPRGRPEKATFERPPRAPSPLWLV